MRLSLVALLVAAAGAGAADLPADLAMVPGDAAGFAHVRLADVWKHPSMAEMRDVFAKAGAANVAKLDEQFVPKPSTVERVTAVLLMPDPKGPPQVVAAIRFSAPFDEAKVRAAYLAKAKPQSAGGMTYYADPGQKIGLAFPDTQTILISDDATLGTFLAKRGGAAGPLAAAVRQANSGLPVVVAVNVKQLPVPPEALEQIPPDIRPVVNADVLTVSMTLGDKPTVTAKLVYADAAAAAAGDKALRKAADMARVMLRQPRQQAEEALAGKGTVPRPLEELPMAVAGVAALGAINSADELLANPPLTLDGNAVAATAAVPAWASQYVGVSAISLGFMLPAVQKVREAAARASSQNNLKQIALAMHNYESAYGNFPAAAVVNKKGKPMLSWRVTILPYIEQENLYRQFKLDEPWDSEHNKKLIPLMPKVYADPRLQAPAGETYYKVFVGGGAMFDPIKGKRFQDITDGTSNTLMAAAGGDPVVWTKPDDFAFDADKDLPDLMKPFGNLMAALADGSVRYIAPTVDKKTLKALITANGGEVVGDF